MNAPLPRAASRARYRSGLPPGAVVCFCGVAGGRGCFQKGSEAHLPRAGSAGSVAGCCRGRWCVLTIGGIEPPLLGYESIPLTTGPVQASCTV